MEPESLKDIFEEINNWVKTTTDESVEEFDRDLKNRWANKK